MAQTDRPRGEPTHRVHSGGTEPQNWFEAFSGGHYFGEDESDEVKRLIPNDQRTLLTDPAIFRRTQTRGELAQLRSRLDSVNRLTPEQEHRLEEILIAERERQERSIKQQYAAHRTKAIASTWYGVSLRASTELGLSIHDQFVAQIEDFSRQQMAAVSTVLTPKQFEVYKRMQHERVMQQRSILDQLRFE